MAKWTRLEFSEGSSDKFWEIAVEGAAYTVRYGRNGTAGSESSKSFDSGADAEAAAKSQIAAKKKKGYLEVGIPDGGDASASRSGGATVKASDAASAKASPAKTKKAFDAKAFEKKHGIAAPPRFQAFLAGDEAKAHKGKYVLNLPHYSSGDKYKVSFCKPGFDLFEDNDIDREDHEDAWMPLATMGEDPQFLAVNLSDEACPVAMWEHEDGMFHPLAPSLDAFLAGLVDKATKAPITLLKESLAKATKLQEKGKHADALAILEPALRDWAPGPQKADGNQGQLAAAYNLLGICLGKLDRLDDSMEAYKNAVECGTQYAALNILDAYADEYNDPARVIEYGLIVKELYLDAYCWFWVRKYLARAYLDTQQNQKAEDEYRAILERFQTREPSHITKVMEELQTYVAEAKPNAACASGILTWFTPKDYSVSVAQAKDNRAWWQGLPSFVQAKLLESIKVTGDPSDIDISRTFDVRSIYLDDEDKLDDVAPLARITALQTLSFFGKPTTLEPLRVLSALKKVSLNRKIIKDLALPDTSNEPLFAAVKKGDLAAIKRALAAGAKINAKDEDFESSPLHLAVTNHDVSEGVRREMALFLIAEGADPFAQNMDNSDVFAYCGTTLKQEIRDAYQARGTTNGAAAEAPFQVAKVGKVANAIRVGSIKGFDEDYMLDAGVPLLHEYPVGKVTVQMDTDYPGHKRDTVLCDYHETFGVPVVSTKFRLHLDNAGVTGVEFLPVSILDHKGKPASEDYFLLNPLAQDCLDLERSEPRYNLIDEDSIDKVKQLIIDETRVAPDAQLFRIKAYGKPLVFRSELAEAVVANGLTNIAFAPPKR